MALKMAANAKPEPSNKQRPRYLDDPERVRKDLEHERRITRLQQVREKSNTLARKIREDVAAEKARQVDKFEQIKQQELNAWREHVVAKKHQDYRTAVFQVGAAHRAALAEIEKTEQQKQLRAKKMQKCRRLASKTQLTKTSASNLIRMQGGKDQNVEGRVTAGTQTPVQAKDTGKENRLCNRKCKQRCDKRRRHPCTTEDLNVSQEDEEITVDILTEESSCDEQTPTTSESGKLRKTPPVILDVDRESEDSLELCSHDGIEINDRHMETNRQFSRIVQGSTTPETQPKASRSRKRFTRISDLVQQLEPEANAPINTIRGADAASLERSSPGRGTAANLGSGSSRNRNDSSSPRRVIAASPQRSVSSKKASDAISSPKQSSSKSTAQQGLSQKRSLRISSKSSMPEKVIDAGIKRGSVTSAASSQAARIGLQGKGKSKSLQEMTKAQAQQKVMPMQAPPSTPVIADQSLQQPPINVQQQFVQQPRQQQMPMQQQPRQQQMPLPQQPVQQPRHQQMPMQQEPLQTPMQHPIFPQIPMTPLHPFSQPILEPNMLPPYPFLPYPFLCQPQGFPVPPMPIFPAAPQMRPIVSSSSNQPTCTTQSTVTTTTSCVGQKPSVTTSTGKRVQYYDHNNKYQRNYEPSSKAVQVNPPNEMQLNAMDHARIETQLSQLREQELEKLRKVSEERGQKALQREQVRRDCAELTEKLDALTQQNPQLLPSDANFVPSHRFADLASRREQKMNEAVEQMLLRPAIVTCPEIGAASRRSPKKAYTHGKSHGFEAINVGEPPAQKSEDFGSAGSCCSMLLDYVDDQSKQLRCELRGMQSNSTKSEKLKDLLQRIEKIRAQLLAELKAGDVSEANAQKVIESISRERLDIHTLDDRESELQRKEALLDQRVKQLYKQQVGKKKDDSPVEIIIKVKSDGTVKQYGPKSQLSDKTSSKDKLKENKEKKELNEGTPSTDSAPIAIDRNIQNQRQNSIDSTSTQYRELPPVTYENVKTASAAPVTTTIEPLHPKIAQYVQRLLSLSKNSIEKLGVSSSDRSTPTSSIINQSNNISGQVPLEDVENERVERAQAFIQDNRSFINELEDTIRGQQKQNEMEEKPVDDISWNTRLASNKKLQRQGTGNNTQKDTRTKKDIPAEKKLGKDIGMKKVKKAKDPENLTEKEPSTKNSPRKDENIRQAERPNSSRSSNTLPKSNPGAPANMLVSNLTKDMPLVSTEVTSRPPDSVQSRSSQGQKSACSSQESSTHQMERYAKLTENCTQRIAELTELITKVREEKQRLVEVTLTSASEGDRHSTEYFDLPPKLDNQAGSDSHNTTTHSNSEAMPPLQKHKPTGASLDSGISGSRPMTAMGGVVEQSADVEPTTLDIPSAANRRIKVPPATIRRYSPQMAEELPHELSTITEVDTPAQSHIAPVPIAFPSFEQYARELQVNLNNLDMDQSLRLKHEFHELIQVIKQRGSTADYREFPSIHAYLHDVTAITTATRAQIEEEQIDQAASIPADELMKWRLSHVTIREFPDRHEYMQQLMASVPPEQRDMIDSASLESSDSLDVEAELRRRRLLKNSFRRTPTDIADNDIASSTRRESIPPNNITNAPNESGIQPYPALQSSMRQRHRETKPQCKSLSSSSPEPRKKHQRSTGGGLSPPQDVSQMGRALNLRDFLTHELLKHRVRSSGSSSESTDDSLKSNFLQSVIDSLSRSSTPKTSGLGHGTNGTNDRQKTSTPVGSFATGLDRTGSVQSSETQLFSVESRISAVNYADGTPPVPFDHQRMSPAIDFRGSNRRNASRK